MPASSREPETELENFTSFFVVTNRISNRIQAALDEVGEGTSLSDWLLLHAASTGSGESLSDIARSIGVSRQRIHQQATALQSNKLATIDQGTDGKQRTVALTPEGKARLKKMNAAVNGLFSGKEEFLTKIQNARKAAVRVAKAVSPQPEAAVST